MKTRLAWTLFAMIASLLAGCLNNRFTPPTPEHIIVMITVVVTAIPQATPSRVGPIAIATELRPSPSQYPSPTPTLTPLATPTTEPSPTVTQTQANTPTAQRGRLPTSVPDYTPGRGMAVLTGESPYELTILPGGWQAYQIGPSSNRWGYLVDVNPRGAAPKGTYIETKILPEYFAGQWVDVLWIRAPGIVNILPVSLDLITTNGWNMAYENQTRLTPGEWTGWGMFNTAEGCGGVLDISPDPASQSDGSAYIANTRVQPEFPGDWVQVIRVQLSKQASPQSAWLHYYTPDGLGVVALDQTNRLVPGEWNAFPVAGSHMRQGYVVEVIPQQERDNEVAFSVVRPESNGEYWEDVLSVFVPEGRPVLNARLRVLAVKVPGQ